MEIAVLILEFLSTRKGYRYWISLVVSVIVGVLTFYCSNLPSDLITTAGDSILNVIGILLGFIISILAIIISGDNQNINGAKEYKVGKQLFSDKQLSLYDRIIIDLCYTILLQSIILLLLLTLPYFIEDACRHLQFISIMIGMSIHVILMIISISLDLYLIVSKK